jgi:SM-20-related protein
MSFLKSSKTFYEKLFSELEKNGYCVMDNFFQPEMVEGLYKEAVEVFNKNLMKKATISQDKLINSSIRGDTIYWLDKNSFWQSKFLEWLENYKNELNRRFFFGINNYEAHFARYEKGSFYKKHYDNFRGKNNRVVTFLLYLNPDWKKEDKGHLIIYKEKPIKIEPVFGRVVTFITEEILHEVEKTQKERYSIAAWLRRDSLF